MFEVDKKVREKNKELVERYPYLLPRNVFTDELNDYNYEFTWYNDIPEGWKIGFGEFLLEDLREVLIKTNYMDEFRFLQIKEKYGRLCLYTNGAPNEVHDVLDKYEFISEYVCIHCGSPYACIVDDYGWYLPLCRECWSKINNKREKKGYRVMSYEEAAGGEYCEEFYVDTYGLPDSYTVERHSNGKKNIIIYDISETTNKIKEAYKERIKTC